MTFDDWWLALPKSIIKERSKTTLAEMAWTAAQAAPVASTLAAFERMADHRQVDEMTPVVVDRLLRNEPPADVEELIQCLNTHGGTCHLEHANMIRAFFNRVTTKGKTT